MGAWIPVTEWKPFFTLIPVFTSDGHFVWFNIVYYRKLRHWCHNRWQTQYMSKQYIERQNKISKSIAQGD